MQVTGRAPVVAKAVVAAIFGTVAGGTAGVWSLPRSAASVNAAAPIPAVAPVVVRPAAAPGAPTPQPARARPNLAPPPAEQHSAPVAPHAASPRSADADALVLERARALARRPDVMALITLRDSVLRRATERGNADSASVRGELEELDQRLNEARAAQLKLDAEAFRNAASKRP